MLHTQSTRLSLIWLLSGWWTVLLLWRRTIYGQNVRTYHKKYSNKSNLTALFKIGCGVIKNVIEEQALLVSFSNFHSFLELISGLGKVRHQ